MAENLEIKKSERSIDSHDFLSGGGEMGELIRSINWSKTALGAVETWSQSLRTSLSTCLNSKFPILLWWGPDMVMLYNEAYRPILGSTKHPKAMGQKGKECWPEIWDIIGPMLEGVLNKGEATWSENQMLPLDRNVYVEECYFTFSYSPIYSENGIGGVFTAVYEVTQQVIAQRRLDLLRELGDQSVELRSTKVACNVALNILSKSPEDTPYSLIYLFDKNEKRFKLESSVGLGEHPKARPEYIPLIKKDALDCHVWPLEKVLKSREPCIVEKTNEHFGDLPGTPWPEPSHTAALLPFGQSGEKEAIGVLIVGISPRKKLDDEYHKFLNLVAGQISTTISNATAFEAERKRAEKLAEIDQAKTVFFSNVSHEFRTPLTLIIGPIEDMLAKDEAHIVSENRELLTIAHRNALRMQKLVNTLLDFSRIEAGRIQASYKATDLSRLTAELASNFQSVIEKAGLKLTVDCPPLPEPVYVDSDMWEKIVLNLLSNAFKCTFEGEVKVAVHWLDNKAELVVQDTGIGIPSAELPRLFERFHQVPNARSRTHEGSGVGLALVNELVKLHGATISVESVVDQGTTFTVAVPSGKGHLPADRIDVETNLASTALGIAPFVEEALRWLPERDQKDLDIPLNKPALQEEIWQGAIFGDNRKARIILADDNADMRDYLYRLLLPHCNVEVVSDGAAALKAARRELPDLILSDIMMPKMDGFELLKEMRKDPSLQSIPIILLSARAGEEAKVEGFQAGANDYLIKPFSAKELMARIQTQLAMLRLRKQAKEAVEIERQNLSDLFRQAPAAIAVVETPDMVYKLANPLYQRLFSRSEEQLLGKSIRQVFPEVEGQGIYELFENVFQSGEAFVANEFPALFDQTGKGDFAQGYYNFVAQPMRDDNGNINAIMIHAFEITEQVKARQKVEESERRFRTIMQQSPLSMQLFDPDGRARAVNPAWEKLWDVDKEYMGEYNILEDKQLQAEGVIPAVKKAFAGEATRLPVVYYDPSHIGKKGRPRWIDAYIYPVTSGNGEILEVVLVHHDITDQKEAEEALRQAEAQFRATFNQAAIAMSISDLNGKWLSFNEVYPQMFGYAAQELEEMTYTDLTLPDDRPLDWKGVAQMLNGNTSAYIQEKRYRHKDGSIVYGIVHASVIRDVAGQPQYIVAAIQDITERKQAQEAVRISEARLKAIVETTPECIKIVDCEGSLQYMNRAGLRMVEADNFGAVEGASVYNLIAPEHRDIWREKHHKICQGESLSWEFDVIGLNGTHRCMETHAAPLLNPDGSFSQLAVTRDITERKQAEETLREREEHFRIFANNIQNLAWMANADGWIYWYNDLWYKYTGTTFEEVQGWHWEKVHHPEHIDRVLNFLKKAIIKEENFELTFPLKGADDQYRWFLTRVHPVKDAQGNVLRWIGTNTDIHDQKMAEQRLKVITEELASSNEELASANEEIQAGIEELSEKNHALIAINADMDNFIYTASHDLKAPIANIEGLMHALEKSLTPDAKEQEIIQKLIPMIYKSITRFKNTIIDLTEITKLQKEQQEDLTEVDLREIVESIKLDLDQQIVESDALLEINLEDCPKIRFSKKNLKSIAYNLLSNAIKYRSPERRPHILVTCEKLNEYILLAVQDNGLGFEESSSNKIFSMFKRMHNHVEGTGIGLYIVKKIIDDAGGKIEVESEVDKGTTFKVYFPVKI